MAEPKREELNKRDGEAALILPNQLYPDGPPGIKQARVYFLEADRYFSDFQFHKKKILLHRASMLSHRDKLLKKGFSITYIENSEKDQFKLLREKLEEDGIESLHAYDPVDVKLRRDFTELNQKSSFNVLTHSSPGFITEINWFKDIFPDRNYRMTQFYREQRKRLGLLIEKGGPEGGKWSFDPENRKSLPEDVKVPELPALARNRNLEVHVSYVNKHFPANPGTTEDFIYPVNRKEAKTWLDYFLEKKFAQFGPYQDAISASEPFIFHSLISPLLNIGLLKPLEVVKAAINYARQSGDIELSSLEGFVRQIIGWREYLRLIYELEGRKQKDSNYWNHSRSVPESFYSASTGITPIDRAIERMQKFAYIHHIERLMVIGNFALLCEIDPEEIYRWFMELSIDSYDWVMTPNVYGMSQYSDGGLITTKPYISSSNYIRKMSDYSTGDWCDVWDGLFWRFIAKHSDKFRSIPRAAVMASNLERMSEETISSHIKTAEDFLNRILY